METFQEAMPEVSDKLEIIVKDFTLEINRCQEQADLWLDRKQKLQQKMSETLRQVQKQCGIEPEVAQKKERTVSQLIREYLEINGSTRAREIRKYLLSQGRTTNPGVALGRLVAEGTIKNTERGVYKLP